MNNYMQRLGLTAWRKKTTILVASGFLSLIIFGLQFSRLEDNSNLSAILKDEKDAEVVAAALAKSINNVRFIESSNKNKVSVTELDDEVLNDITIKREAKSEKQTENVQMEQQLGIPYVNLDPKNPYIPKTRIVHLDFKGAPPVISYLKKFFPLIKQMGATGVLLGKLQ